MWQPQVEFFGKDYQVVTYDARGFGKSSLPEGPYDHAVENWLNHELFTAIQKRPEVVAALRSTVESYSWHWLRHDPQSPANTHARDHLHEIDKLDS